MDGETREGLNSPTSGTGCHLADPCKAYHGSIVDRIEVDDREIRIVGRKNVLEQAVLANGGAVSGVRSFVRKWRSLGESNPSFQIENLTS